MPKTAEHKACLSTSISPSPQPPVTSRGEGSEGSGRKRGVSSGQGIGERDGPVCGHERESEVETSALTRVDAVDGTPKESGLRARNGASTDYVLVFCYILIYLEVAWLIYMLLRSYSRD
jgi:hypothetical protein